MKAKFAVLLGLACLVNSAQAETVYVTAKANPWLAGMTNGSTARRGDSAPDESPVPITATVIEGGATYVFGASGSANHGTTLPFFPPDGEDLISHYLGAENGIADLTAPFVSLVGVFLSPTPPDQDQGPAPQPLDFRTPADREYVILAPALKQPFFIGDGLTSSGTGTVQRVVAPAGATRLFLGVMDQYQWSDNEGGFTVQITRETSPPPPVQLALHPSAHPTLADAAGNPRSPTAPGPELHAFNAIELVWPSEANRRYQLQWTPSLEAPEWVNLGPIVPGSGANVSVLDSTRMHAQGFYRVQIVQR